MIICDIDGCLFNNYHRSHLIPEDKTRCENWHAFNSAFSGDIPVEPVINFVNNLAEITGQKVIFITSRPEDFRQETTSQLFQYFGHINHVLLCMRTKGDNRSAVEFKKSKIKNLPLQFGVNSMIIDDNREIIDMAISFFPKLNTLLTRSFDCTLHDENVS